MHRTTVARLVAGLAAACSATAAAAALRFAFVYRRRAGFPARRPPLETPATYGLAFEVVAVPSPAGPLPGWFIPAPGGGRAPVIVLVHGWESNRARMLPNARFLHAAGFHTLMFDVRGHGENPPETLPITAAEFGADAAAAAALGVGRPDVTSVGIFGHSMGAAGAAIAAAAEPRIAAVVLTSTPSDPHTLTRRTFELAGLRIPGPVAGPLARLTLRVFLRPRRHSVADASASSAVRRIRAPMLLIHGRRDEVVPVASLALLAAVANARPADRVTETLELPDGYHRWMFEIDAYRTATSGFFARHLAGAPEASGAVARALTTHVTRQADTEGRFAALAKPGRGDAAPATRNVAQEA